MKLTIIDDNNKKHIIKCTEDHKIWIESKNKYIQAKDLKENMQVIIRDI